MSKPFFEVFPTLKMNEELQDAVGERGGLKGCDQFIPGVYPGAFAKQTLDSEKRDL